jgi:hypothetical protein
LKRRATKALMKSICKTEKASSSFLVPKKEIKRKLRSFRMKMRRVPSWNPTSKSSITSRKLWSYSRHS